MLAACRFYRFPKAIPFARGRGGFSLVEILVALAIMAAVTLGVSTLMTSLNQQYYRANFTQTLETLRQEIINNISGSGAGLAGTGGAGVAAANMANDSWFQTMQNNAEFACILNNQTCAATGWLNISLWGPVQLDGLGNPTPYIPDMDNVAGAGFDRNGLPCTTFDGTAGAGNNDCPIQYQIQARLLCETGVANCVNPAVEIRANLNVNAPGNFYRPDQTRYSFVMRKSGGSSRSVSVVIAEIISTAGGANEGTSRCNPGNWISRGARFACGGACGNLSWRRLDDQFDSVQIAGAGIRFMPGYWTCNVTVPAWSVNRFDIRLNVGAGVNEASGFASRPNFASGTATVTQEFAVNDPNGLVYNVEFRCSTAPIVRDFAFGMWGEGPGGVYSETTLSALRCTRRLP